jgi:hypothetical protein
MIEGFKWGDDPQRDCQELKRLEGLGLYPSGHHDQMCPVCTDALPVVNEVVAVVEPQEDAGDIELQPRGEITD